MQAHRTTSTISGNKSVTLENLPFPPGCKVDVIVLPQRNGEVESEDRYSLRGTTIQYIDPTEPVAAADWEASQ